MQFATAQIVGLPSFFLDRGQVKASDCVAHMQECAARFQTPNFYYRRPQAFFNLDQLPDEIGGRVVSLSRSSSVEQP
jgi:hypothetical protein